MTPSPSTLAMDEEETLGRIDFSPDYKSAQTFASDLRLPPPEPPPSAPSGTSGPDDEPGENLAATLYETEMHATGNARFLPHHPWPHCWDGRQDTYRRLAARSLAYTAVALRSDEAYCAVANTRSQLVARILLAAADYIERLP